MPLSSRPGLAGLVPCDAPPGPFLASIGHRMRGAWAGIQSGFLQQLRPL